MTNSKIEGKFYPLQYEEWLHACHELTPAERDVLYFVRSLDPYGNGLDLSIAEIARQLSSKRKQVHRSTVSRALKTLNEKNFIDLELITVSAKVKAKGIHCCEQPEETVVVSEAMKTTQPCQDNEPDPDATVLPQDNNRDRDTTSVIMTQPARSQCNPAKLELLSAKGSETYKNIKKIKTLSENEREKFFEFAMNKVDNLPNRPALPNKWIEANFDELYQQFSDKTKPTETSQALEKWRAEVEQRRLKAEQAYREQLAQKQAGDSHPSEEKSSDNPQSNKQPSSPPKPIPQQGWQNGQDELEQRRMTGKQARRDQLAQKQAVAPPQPIPVASTPQSSAFSKQPTPSPFPRSQSPHSYPTHSQTTRLGTDTFERLNDIWHDNG